MILDDDWNLRCRSLDELEMLCNRLYCVRLALVANGDRELIGKELDYIWGSTLEVIEAEKECLSTNQEEMKKFHQGFAYKAPEVENPRCY